MTAMGTSARRKALLRLVLLASPLLTTPARAQAVVAGVLRLVVPVTPGGAADTIARLLAEPLSEKLHMTVVVDNRPGAATQIAAEAVAQAKPDGLTVLFTTDATAVINPGLYERLRYAPSDLLPITLAVRTPFVLVSSSSFPARTIRELVDLAKERKGAVSYASIGIGSPQHLCMEVFAKRAGIALNHVPYSGGGAALNAVGGEQVDLMLASIGGAAPHLKSGRFRALGMATSTRSGLLPEVPTIAESGFDGYEAGTWLGFYGPARMPIDTAHRLQESIREVLDQASMRERLRVIGAEVVGNTPAQFAQIGLREAAQWKAFIREAGIKAE